MTALSTYSFYLRVSLKSLLLLALSVAYFSTGFGQSPPSKVVMVVLENKPYEEIVGHPKLPYLNSLINHPKAAVMTNSYALARPSQPNYLQLFAGSTQGVNHNNIPLGVPFTTPNIAASLRNRGYSFCGYSEDLPAVGSSVERSGHYVRKHNPWVNWQGTGTNQLPDSVNRPWTHFPTDYNQMPTYSIIIPNEWNDMHTGPMDTADAWLQTQLSPIINWCLNNNSLFILTFDEDNNSGLFNNHILTLFLGQHTIGGQYTKHVTHYNVLRTLEQLYGLPYSGISADSSAIPVAWRTLMPLSSNPNRIKKTVFQGFWWDYWNNNYPNGWANYLTDMAPRLKAAGFDAIWVPPIYKNSSTGSVGYSPFDMYDLGDKYQKGGGSLNVRSRVGTKDELLRMIAVMHANGIEVIQDVVMNHNDGAGSNTGGGGQDPEATFSAPTNSGYKNFRFTSYGTPLLDDSQNDYWSRAGRWSKNYPNFHATLTHNCTTGAICEPMFGPDICYFPSAFGQSSNIPTTGTVNINGITRPYHNPAQSSGYMRNNSRSWIQWFKKQTGSDGWRWDAIKHFEIDVQEDLIYNTKYTLPTWANGGQNMFNVGEWVGGQSDLDAYVNNVKTGSAPGGITNEKHTGTFDFAIRGFGSGQGLYGMIHGFGGYDMQSIPGQQQLERYMDYGGKRVHRTVPFINNHDTYRPILLGNGNLGALGDNSSWNTGSQLASHVDPREPRVAAAYAVAAAVDGNPGVFFEDLFDIGTTGKRYTHLPTSSTDLPINADIQNIMQAHQRLAFKDGDYAVPTASGSPFYQKGSSGDHLVIERKNKALIGITDAFSSVSNNSADQEVYVGVDAAWIGKQLYDYSGAHGLTTSQVFNDSRVLIRTAPVGHTIPGALGHGYSIWAPAPDGVTFTSVQQMYDYLSTYQQPLNTFTTQEWEMANDLGDSHCLSLGQGGSLPANSTNQRVAGKIYTDVAKLITYKAFPEVDGANLTLSLWDLDGNKLSEVQGISTAASPLTGTYTPSAVGWLIVKLRYSTNNQAAQKAWVNVAYTAPTAIDTRLDASKPDTRASVWTGNKDNADITDCGNWEEGKLPTSATNVIIPAYSSPMPIMNSGMSVRNLVIESGASLTINNATLKIAGSINNAGSLVATTATIEMNGTTAQSVPANTFSTNTIQSFTINNAAGVSLGGTLNVTQVYTPTQGTLGTNGFLVLKSDASNTARVAAGSAGGGYISGDVIVERHIPAKRAWRLMTSPLSNANSIRQAWQNDGVFTAGTGMFITAPAGSGTGTDDALSFSLRSYNTATQSLDNINTTLTPLSGAGNSAANKVYFAFVRGDRNPVNLTPPNTNATVLAAKGQLQTGNQTFTVVKKTSPDPGIRTFTALGNPYASPVDFATLNRTGVSARFWVWDPKRNGANGVGAYVLLDESAGYTPIPTGGSYTSATSLLQSGQAFFVESNDEVNDGSIVFKESDKQVTGANVFRTETTNGRLNISLEILSTDTSVADGVLATFSAAGTNQVSMNDAGKMTNLNENLAIRKVNTNLTIDHRPLITLTDTIKLQLWNTTLRNYRLAFQPTNFTGSETATLLDRFNNTSIPLSLNVASYYNFSVTSNSQSSAADRFYIVLNQQNILPLTFITASAGKSNGQVDVKWNVAASTEIQGFEVERSSNANDFNLMAKVGATAAIVYYQFSDKNPITGTSYYRIKMLGKTGSIVYSNILKVQDKLQSMVTIYPNPTKNKQLSVQLNQLPQARYTITLFNTLGQKAWTNVIDHRMATGTYNLFLQQVAKGNYQLQISNDSYLHNTSIVVQ